ncbi:unnamed protein product [Dibothriocephalus latus]|uniref:Helix-turn-helix domain-containing protein n=1 Tax=Dibothriocephalus latus TaxID=60516 RepID=A0A3P7LDZ6_DIBLA|nr:unnamed protein product [Dibothriocephalus latus]
MQVLNDNSYHPISHKRSCVKIIYRRVEMHCSEQEDKLPEKNAFDGCSEKMATRATSSTAACANVMANKGAPTPKVSERSCTSKTYQNPLAAFSHHLELLDPIVRPSAAFSHHLELELHTGRRQP